VVKGSEICSASRGVLPVCLFGKFMGLEVMESRMCRWSEMVFLIVELVNWRGGQ
jgi:hypothetical protein